MTPTTGIRRDESSSKSSRRSRSPENRSSSSPESIRRRSEDVRSYAERKTDALRAPAYLRQTKPEISGKFQTLETLQMNRMEEGTQSQDPRSRWWRETDFEVLLRNRYMNVQPWANHRIHLHVPDGHCDYINASPITLKSQNGDRESHYIATQGPKQGQFNHVWRMIWYETANIGVIVMLTKTWEAGRDKCFQYFPETLENNTLVVNDEDECGDGFKATVKLLELEHDELSRSTVRKLLITVGDEEKIIWHLLFSGWPDFSVPEGANRTALLELIKLSASKNIEAGSPRLIHCSAGVGRSGTFIALDYLLEELVRGNLQTAPDDTDIIFDTVNRMREQRIMMVQSEAQFAFIYQVMLQKWNERYLQHDSVDAQNTRTSLAKQSPTKEEIKAAELASLAQEANAEMARNVEKMEY